VAQPASDGELQQNQPSAPPRPPRPPYAKNLPPLLRALANGHARYREEFDATIHPGDEMFRHAENTPAARFAYFGVAHTAMASITAAMVLAGKQELGSILDIPCGHGRITRMLRARWPAARIAACDLLTEGVDFCAQQFGAVPIYSDPDPARIPTDEQFDLIWSGSLLTHLDKPLWQPFLRFFSDHLKEDGLLVFSTLGRCVVLHPPQRALARIDHREPLRDAYLAEGFAYMDQTDPRCPWHTPDLKPGYGVTWASPQWVIDQMMQLPDLRVLALWERGWNEHQDVVVAMKRPVGAPRQPLTL
jgi:SAM-dependent methyltransferase